MNPDSFLTLNAEGFLYGGDYNPEQFDRSVWDEDVKLMKVAGWNIATLPVFGWGNIQVAENDWNFDWLDEILGKLTKAKINLCIATATAATPPWLDRQYPDVLRVDSNGVKLRHGGRHTFCPNSSNFRRLSSQLAEKMAERYATASGLKLWHVSNEYGNPCYCDVCSAQFRKWLMAKYGDLAEINHRWNMAFWGQSFTDIEQIEAPTSISQNNFQGLRIDYARFQSESILQCCQGEIAAIRHHSQGVPITTNMMGPFKPLDYHEWAQSLDIVSWDSYPRRGAHPSETAMSHSLMRGLKLGRPWLLMEQTPSQQNWQKYNSLKAPGVMKLWSMQAIAHGSESAMFFQWRRSPGAQEMLHGAVLGHAGRTDARVFEEVAKLGADLKELGAAILGSTVKNKAAIIFDWNAWWAVEFSSGPSVDLDYLQEVRDMYRAFWDLGIGVDVVSPNAELSGYQLVVAPCLKMIKPGFAEKVENWVDGGGAFAATYFTGIVDETDRAFPNGYPGPLSSLLGIWVEETDALSPDESNLIIVDGQDEFQCGLLCDRIRLQGAEAVAHYGKAFYSGEPCITENSYGKGASFYLGAKPNHRGYHWFAKMIAKKAGVAPDLFDFGIEGLETVIRRHPSGAAFAFLLNHTNSTLSVPCPIDGWADLASGTKIDCPVDLSPYGVQVWTSATN